MTSQDQVERNKKAAVEYLQMAINERNIVPAYDKYVGENYVTRSPNFETGARDKFPAGVTALVEAFPELDRELLRVAGEGDYVWMHSRWTFAPGDRPWSVVDIFRFDENGKVVEHWDVGQQVPEAPANPVAMF